MSSQIFSSLQPAPDDPILGLNELFKNDARAEKVNLGVGVFLNEEGKLPLMKAVAEAEKDARAFVEVLKGKADAKFSETVGTVKSIIVG